MEKLYALLGAEHELAEVGRELRATVRSLSPATVGAGLLHCSDETEHETVEAFQHTFAQDLLPRLKYGSRVPFHMANPGARYEWGAAGIAENHFATSESADGFKVVVAKVNGHCGVMRSGADGLRFGVIERYGSESTCCGAIHALLAGSDLPLVEDLADALRSEGRDRVAQLGEVEERLRPLFGAMVSARLQARLLVQDLQDHTPSTPTLYIVVFGVTLNKPGPDTEIPGGVYLIDRRTGTARDRYRGLGDDPRAYALEIDVGRMRITDPHIAEERDARDHRKLAGGRLRTLQPASADAGAARDVVERAQQAHTGRARGVLLKSLLTGLVAVAPVPVALVLAAEGVSAMHHIHKLHQVDEKGQRRNAEEAIAAVHARVDELPPEDVERVTARLLEELGPRAPGF